MDPKNNGFLDSPNVHQLGNQSFNGPRFEITYPDQRLVSGNENQIYSSQDYSIGGAILPQNQTIVENNDDSQDDSDFSDEVLRYIDQILMEEDMEDRTHMLQESLDLIDIIDPSWMNSRVDIGDTSIVQSHSTYRFVESYISSSNSLSNVLEGFSDSPVSPLQIRDIYSESQSVWNFQKGVEEASKFLPAIYADSNLPAEEFDNILLHSVGEIAEKFAAFRSDPFDYLCSGSCCR